MKKITNFTFIMFIALALMLSSTNLVIAQIGVVNETGGPLTEENMLVTRPDAEQANEDHAAVETWITKWYGLDGNYINSGGFNTSGPIDLMALGTNDQITDVSLSTVEGLLMTQDIDVEWPEDNGGTRGWTVFEINPDDGNNIVRGGPADNFDHYAVIVIDSPEDMTSVMSPAQDDYAQIWINGEKWHNNSRWTGGAKVVDYNVEVELQKGTNVLLFRCGEGGGSAYFNLHFDDATHNAITIYPKDATDKASFFEEIAPLTAVEAAGKLTTIWADIKRK